MFDPKYNVENNLRTSVNKIWNHKLSQKFREMQKQKLRENENKTMNVHYSILYNKIKEEFFEVVERYQKEENSGLAQRYKILEELADLSNICLLFWLSYNGIRDKELSESK